MSEHGQRRKPLRSDRITQGAECAPHRSLLKAIEDAGCPACGSCSGLFTANSMNCISEALGLALPFNGTALAKTDERTALAERAGREILRLIDSDLTARQVAVPAAFDDAFALDMLMGGSSNTVLHLLAIAREAEVDYDLHRLNELADRVPQLTKISPASDLHMEDLHAAGGIPALLAELQRATGVLHVDRPTAGGPNFGEVLAEAKVTDRKVILSFDEPHSATGGLAVLFGNLAPEGAVVKTGAVDPAMRRHSGPARIYESQDEALQPGDVIFIDVDARTLDVDLSDDEIAGRLEAVPPFEAKTTSSWLKRYSKMVTSAATGAVLSSD